MRYSESKVVLIGKTDLIRVKLDYSLVKILIRDNERRIWLGMEQETFDYLSQKISRFRKINYPKKVRGGMYQSSKVVVSD